MRFFASWWERVPVRQIGAVVAVVAVLGLLSFQFGAGARPGSVFANLHIQRPSGEVWD